MGVDIKDFRRHIADADKRPEPPKALLQQETSDKAVTGNEDFDKLIRVLESKLQEAKRQFEFFAQAGILAPEDKIFRTYQLQAAMASGYIKGLLDAQDLPALIMTERITPSVLAH